MTTMRARASTRIVKINSSFPPLSDISFFCLQPTAQRKRARNFFHGQRAADLRKFNAFTSYAYFCPGPALADQGRVRPVLLRGLNGRLPSPVRGNRRRYAHDGMTAAPDECPAISLLSGRNAIQRGGCNARNMLRQTLMMNGCPVTGSGTFF